MNNLKKIDKFDPVIEKFITSHDKASIKKLLLLNTSITI